jgi:hypothetical protein
MKHNQLKKGNFSGSLGFEARIQSTCRQPCLEQTGIRDR